MKKEELLRFLEPMPVMFYLAFIGLLIGITSFLGMALTFIGFFWGSMFLLEELKSSKL